MPQPMTTARAWAGRLIKSFPLLVRLVGRSDLLVQLVPTQPVAHLGAQLPLQRLRLRVDGRPQLVQPRSDEVSIDLQLAERIPQLAPVPPQHAVHAPVLSPPL